MIENWIYGHELLKDSLDFQHVDEKFDGASLNEHSKEDDDERGREENLLRFMFEIVVLPGEDVDEGEADGAAEAPVRQDHLLPPRDRVLAVPVDKI